MYEHELSEKAQGAKLQIYEWFSIQVTDLKSTT